MEYFEIFSDASPMLFWTRIPHWLQLWLGRSQMSCMDEMRCLTLNFPDNTNDQKSYLSFFFYSCWAWGSSWGIQSLHKHTLPSPTMQNKLPMIKIGHLVYICLLQIWSDKADYRSPFFILFYLIVLVLVSRLHLFLVDWSKMRSKGFVSQYLMVTLQGYGTCKWFS